MHYLVQRLINTCFNINILLWQQTDGIQAVFCHLTDDFPVLVSVFDFSGYR